jgi:hypothetical protein
MSCYGESASIAGESITAISPAIEPSTIIHLNPSNELGVINPNLYGVNHRFNNQGYGIWNPATGAAFEKFNVVFDEAGFTSFRYPGGTVGNLFRWKQTIGPREQRGKVYSEINNAPVDIDFGLDEAASYAEAHNATITYMYGAALGSAEDAADLVEYLNCTNDGSNPNGGTDWAVVRALKRKHLQ